VALPLDNRAGSIDEACALPVQVRSRTQARVQQGKAAMRVLIDLKHPAQVRFFQPIIEALHRGGDEVLVTSRAKDETEELLAALRIPHVRLSRPGGGPVGMGMELARRAAGMVRVAAAFRPHVLVARTGVTIGLTGRLLGIPAITFEDTDYARTQELLSVSLASGACTGMGYRNRLPVKQFQYNAPPQLLYTHPVRFRPSKALLREHGLDPCKPYVVMRCKSWSALHDYGVRGSSEAALGRLAHVLSRYGRVLVSTERSLPGELKGMLNPVPAEHMLHALAFARLYVGEGSSSAAEAACLGTPAIFVSPHARLGYLDAMEQRFGHVRTVRTLAQAGELAQRWLRRPTLRAWSTRVRQQLLRACDDPLDFIVGVIRSHGPKGRSGD